MISKKQMIAGLSLALLVATALPGHAGEPQLFGPKKKKEVVAGKKLTPEQSALIDKAVVREKNVVKVVKERAPLVETYIQNMRPDPVMRQVPESDEHFLGRVEFGRIIGDSPFEEGPKAGKKQSTTGHFLGSLNFIKALGGSLHLQYSAAGFTQMLLMDSSRFDKQHYNFFFVRNDFLGSIPTAVFDVTPMSKTPQGFFGRIWVETGNGNVVRFNGDFAGGEKDYHEFFHFDSWRTNVQPDLWLPTSFYVEESDPKSVTSTLKFKAINHVWGYVLKVPASTAEITSVEVAGTTDVSQDATDCGPRCAQAEFLQQAEDNVVERLFQAGLLDAPSEFDKTLELLVNNILAYNNIAVARPVRVRTLLTEPLESLSIGNTIILSKSLIDTTAVQTADGAQQMGDLNAILAFQLAHILSGHKLDTKFAFNDRLLFPDNSAFRRIPMHHSDADNAEAAKKTLDLLNAKELVDSQKYFGLYLQQLQQRIKGLKALNEPMIGDGLVKSDTDPSFWLQALVGKADKLDVKDLKQQGAVPLSSYLRFDPWTDKVITLHTAFEPILSPSDKMPFEVTPVYIKLGYFKPPAADPGPPPAATAPAAADSSTAAPTAPAAPAADPGTAAPATATPPATPPPSAEPKN